MNETAEQLWSKASSALQARLSSDIYSHWIAVIKPKAIEGDTLLLTVSNDFYVWWLEEHYLKLISDAVAAVGGDGLAVRIDTDKELQEPASPAPAEPEEKVRSAARGPARRIPLLTGTQMNPNYSFDSFVVGPSNSFAHASSLAVAQAPGKAYNPLFLYGGVALGKTHLMQAIGQHIAARSSNASICYISCETMLNEYIWSLQNQNTEAFRKKYRSSDVLLVDDVHFLAGKNALQEEFFHTFNQLFNARKQIVVTSDRAAGEITGLAERLVSRFEWGQVGELWPPDFETRVAILRSKEKAFNIVLSEDVISFIAEHIRSNVRKLEGALTRVASYASFCGKPITLELVEEQLQSFLELERSSPSDIPAIQRKVADYFDVRLADLVSTHRTQALAFPRQIAMYLCRNLTKASYPEIGVAFNKTHATVLHAHKVINGKRSKDPQLDRLIGKLIKQLNPDL